MNPKDGLGWVKARGSASRRPPGPLADWMLTKYDVSTTTGSIDPQRVLNGVIQDCRRLFASASSCASPIQEVQLWTVPAHQPVAPKWYAGFSSFGAVPSIQLGDVLLVTQPNQVPHPLRRCWYAYRCF